ncbi:MAG: type II toxin-antitoxin system VapC family toxin [Candidatus Omnitrophica bacterium]|nr:type II toxin-antitoxin system VapC family toxin [Candidatus Omnitrophota bacterium]
MILVDSSGWLEFFTGGPLSSAYAHHLKDLRGIVTPTIVLYEVYKVIKRERSEEEALAAVAQIGKTHLIPLTDTIALTAADVSLTYQLAMADAIVYATALTEQAKLLTSDADLAPLSGVTYLKKS